MGLNNKQQQEEKYLEYIGTHVANVQKACAEYGEAMCNRIGCSYDELKEQVKTHDQSKYSVEEFEPYRKKFYPANGDTTFNHEYDLAWLHHIHNNPHHPCYWCLVSEDGFTPLPMDPVSIIHMICDWQSFDYIGKGNAYDFYYKVDHKLNLLNDISRDLLERALDSLKEALDEKI